MAFWNRKKKEEMSLEEENRKLKFQLDMYDMKMFRHATGMDLDLNSDLMSMYGIDIKEARNWVTSGDGTRFGYTNANDISLDEAKRTVDETNNKAWEFYVKNPIAKKQIKFTTAHIVGKGFSVYSDNHQFQAIIDKAYYDEANRMSETQRELSNRFQIEGSFLVLLTCTAPFGDTYIREIPMAEVYQIIANQNDNNRIDGIVREYQPRKWFPLNVKNEYMPPGEYREVPQKIYETIEALDWDNLPQRNKQDYIQDIIYVKIPSLSNRKRGISELASHLPWLKRHEQLAIARVIMNIVRTSVVFLHKIKGDTADISRLQSVLNKVPPPGSVLTVNENAEGLEAISPKLDASDARSDEEMVKQFSIVGSNLNEPALTGRYQGSSFAGTKQAARDLVKSMEELQSGYEFGMKQIFTRAVKAAVHYGTVKTIKLTIPRNLTDVNKIKFNKDILEADMPPTQSDLPPQYAMDDKASKLEHKKKMIERCLKTENCWNMPISFQVELLEMWDDEMEEVEDYIMLKKNGKFVEKNIYDLIQVKFPNVQIEDPLQEAQAISLDIQNQLVDWVTASQKRGYDPERVWQRNRREKKSEPEYEKPEPPDIPPQNSAIAPDANDVQSKPRDPKSPRAPKPKKDYV